MKPTDYKPGDIVTVTSAARVLSMAAQLGATAVVQDPAYVYDPHCGWLLNLKWDRTNSLCGGQTDGTYWPDTFTRTTLLLKQQIDYAAITRDIARGS